MKNILIPIDFRFNNYDAIDYAIHFLKNEKCEFYFLNTYKSDISQNEAFQLIQGNFTSLDVPKKRSLDCLGKAIHKYTYNNDNKNHHFNAISEYSYLIEGVKKTIAKLNIDLVILSGKKHFTNKESYSKNIKSIIENVRECPIMIVPPSKTLKKSNEFVFVSNFETEIPTQEITNWYNLVKIVNGNTRFIALTKEKDMTNAQRKNLKKLQSASKNLSGKEARMGYLTTKQEVKRFVESSAEYIICIMDNKPNFWRKLGLSQSKITNFGPLNHTPLIALHG